MKKNKLFKLVLIPYIIYSAINLIFMFLAVNNVGELNNDNAYGMFISWIFLTFTQMIILAFSKTS